MPWNVVISDNGSTDRTVATAQRYADRLPGLMIVDSSERAGPGYARNVGSRATPARILAFCDADDEVGPGWLAAIVAAVEEHRFVAGRFDPTKLNDAHTLRSRELQQSTGLQESPFGPGLPHAGAGNLGVTREVFFSVGGFDPSVGTLEDTDLCWRIQLTGVPLVFAPEALMHVRLRSSLRSMWGQGKSYGMASALLEHRYPAAVSKAPAGPPTDPAAATAETPRPSARRPGASRTATLISLIRDQRSLGALLWTLGWHVGHRQWRPRPVEPLEPVQPVSAGGSRAADAA